MTPQVIWTHPEHATNAARGRTSVEFFYGGEHIARITNPENGKAVDINIWGELSIDLWLDEVDKAGEELPFATLRTVADLDAHGLTSDDAIHQAEARLSFRYSPWFEVTPVTELQSISVDGCPPHSVIDEALGEAFDAIR